MQIIVDKPNNIDNIISNLVLLSNNYHNPIFKQKDKIIDKINSNKQITKKVIDELLSFYNLEEIKCEFTIKYNVELYNFLRDICELEKETIGLLCEFKHQTECYVEKTVIKHVINHLIENTLNLKRILNYEQLD